MTVAAPAAKPTPRGHETLLLVEDEPGVRALAQFVLKRFGYRVLTAVDGVEALKVCAEGSEHIDLLVTDVIMPNMGGRALAEALKLAQPQLRVFFLSGYADDAVVGHGLVAPAAAFLQKPFTMDALAHKVREVLDGPR